MLTMYLLFEIVKYICTVEKKILNALIKSDNFIHVYSRELSKTTFLPCSSIKTYEYVIFIIMISCH